MRYLLITLAILACVACSPESQIQADQAAVFLKYYGNTTDVEGASAQEGADVQPTPDGGYVVLGNSNAFSETPNANNHDLYLIKTDAEGNELWSSTYGRPDRDERAKSLFLLADGSLLLLANQKQLGSDSSKIALWKVNLADGGLVWETVLRANSASSEELYAAERLAGDSLMLTGSTTAVDVTKSNYNPDTDVKDVYTALVDETGSLVWQRVYGFPNEDEGAFIHQRNNELIVIGTTAKANEQTTVVEEGLFMIKYQKGTGLVNGQNNFALAGRNLHSVAAQYEPSSDTYYVLAVERQSGNAEQGIARLSPDLVWDESQDFNRIEGLFERSPSSTALLHADLLRATDGRYYVFNTSYFSSGALLDWQLSALSADLNAVDWQKQYGGAEDDFIGQLRLVYGDTGLETQSLQGFLLVGSINFSTNPMVAFIRTNAQGDLALEQ